MSQTVVSYPPVAVGNVRSKGKRDLQRPAAGVSNPSAYPIISQKREGRRELSLRHPCRRQEMPNRASRRTERKGERRRRGGGGRIRCVSPRFSAKGLGPFPRSAGEGRKKKETQLPDLYYFTVTSFDSWEGRLSKM